MKPTSEITDPTWQDILDRDKEIKRLEKMLDVLTRQNQRLMNQHLPQRDAEIDELEVKIEQLTQALGLLTTLHPTMEIDVSDPLGMAQKIEAHVIAEIEQLKKEAIHWKKAFTSAQSEELAAAAEADELRAETKRLKMELASAAESLVEWGAYVDDYYKKKWDFDKTVEQIKQSAGENQ